MSLKISKINNKYMYLYVTLCVRKCVCVCTRARAHAALFKYLLAHCCHYIPLTRIYSHGQGRLVLSRPPHNQLKVLSLL